MAKSVQRNSDSLLIASEEKVLYEVTDYPPPSVGFDELPEEEEKDGISWDQPWKHFEAALNSFGYKIFWWGSWLPGIEDSPTRHEAEGLPPPLDPFSPLEGEALAAYPLGHYEIRQAFRMPNLHSAYDRLGRRVMIKAVQSSSSELAIAVYLAAQRRFHPDPRNHTIPFLDILKVGKWAFLIMPEWTTRQQPYNVGEYADWFKQLLEGLVYMHEHGIAFRDVSLNNILWNYGGDYAPCVGEPFASLFDARYAYIDFGQSTKFAPGTSVDARKVTGTVHTPEVAPPELSDTEPYDPFAVDVFALGKCMQIQLDREQNTSPVPIVLWRTMPGIPDILARMTSPEPSNRPTASQALSKLRDLLENTSHNVLQAPGCPWLWGKVTKPDHCIAPDTFADRGPRLWRWKNLK